MHKRYFVKEKNKMHKRYLITCNIHSWFKIFNKLGIEQTLQPDKEQLQKKKPLQLIAYLMVKY